MKTTGTVAVVVFATCLSAPAAADAANKEHQQLMAEIRMLQEQQQQLQQMIGSLADTLKTMSARMDDQTGITRKGFADQSLLINNIGDTVRTLREKADDTNVRLSTMTQEIQALRQSVSSIPPPSPTPSGEPPAIDPATGQPVPSNPSIATNPPPANISPTRMFDQAFADYTAGQFDLAVEGFQAYIRTFPTSPNAHEAQLNIGYSLYGAGKYREAIAALQKVTTDYPQSPSVPKAYYKMGLAYEALKQPADARRAYETLIKNYEKAFDTQLARQRLAVLDKSRD